MCRRLAAHGVRRARLQPLRPASTSPRGSQLVVATPSVRHDLGGTLATRYAPVVLAQFGAGPARIEVRAVAPHGVAAYRTQLAADGRARAKAGRELTRNPRITMPGLVAGVLRAGHADARVLVVLGALAGRQPFRITSLSDAGPGASPAVPDRAVTVTPAPARQDRQRRQGRTTRPPRSQSALRQMQTFLVSLRPPYHPLRVRFVQISGVTAVRAEFSLPFELGLLAPPGHYVRAS
jgi:hypothetical protein